MKNIPKEIFLQTGQEQNEGQTDFKDLDGVTWSEHAIFGGDIKYLSKESVEQLIQELRRRLEYQSVLYTHAGKNIFDREVKDIFG